MKNKDYKKKHDTMKDCLECINNLGIHVTRFSIYIECKKNAVVMYQITSKRLYKTMNLLKCKPEKRKKSLDDFK